MIRLDNIHIQFDRVLLQNESIVIPYGKITGIIGKSGCGKTTLLQNIALLDQCVDMKYSFDDIDIHQLSNDEKEEFCRENISFIFQDVYLFEDLNIKENILFHMSLVGKEVTDDEIVELLDFVDLNVDLMGSTRTLSGGEMQRLSIVCGLIKDAKIFIFDEPTAYLDQGSKNHIIEIIEKLAYEKKKIVLIASHDKNLFSLFDRIYKIEQQHMFLIKDCSYQISNCMINNSSLSFKVLKEYVHIVFNKHIGKRVLFMIFFSVMLSLMIVLQTYSQNYQFKNNATLLNILQYQVKISHKDSSDILPESQAILKETLSDYKIYSNVAISGKTTQNISVDLCYYLPSQKDHLQILSTSNQSSKVNDQQFLDIYISYSLYRNVLQENKNFEWIYDNMNFDINYSYILSPSQTSQDCIYISYDDFQKIMGILDIDIGLLDTQSLIVPIQSIEDVHDLIKKLPEQFIIQENKEIIMNIELSYILSSYYIVGIISFTLLSLILYKIYQIYADKKELGLLKSLGIGNKRLIKMKLYQQLFELLPGIMLTVGLSTLLLWILQLLSITSLFIIIVCSFLFHMIFFAVICFSYWILLTIYTAVKLLK